MCVCVSVSGCQSHTRISIELFIYLQSDHFKNVKQNKCATYNLKCVAVCCSVLQCVAVCCRVLQCVAVCCSVCYLQFENKPDALCCLYSAKKNV